MREKICFRKLAPGLALCGLLSAPGALAQESSRLDEVLDAIVANERKLAVTLERYQPLVETYLQTVKSDPVLGYVPIKDNYFFARLELGTDDDAFGDPDAPRSKKAAKKAKKKTLSVLDDSHSQTFKPEAFARMLILDRGGFDRQNYRFDFIRSEFLGEIRTLVFDVTPRPGRALNRMQGGRFTGRIWVEDRDYHIVRFNGIYDTVISFGFHFDSWRLNMTEGQWLPAYVYTEEPERTMRQMRLTHRGQTRIWAYRIKRHNAEEEFTKVLIDTPQTNDPSDQPGYISPVESARAWESEAEDNVLRRLQRAGLIAPEGEVSQVLETVVTNLEITNELDIQPPVRARVLLTTPLESFTVGHTIVVSRGLLDVLPDEASLAMVLAHELGHVLEGHELDTRFAFSDQILVGDRQALESFDFNRDPEEELAADNLAVELLQNSPYKDDLATAGLFLKALSADSGNLPSLIRPHFGSRMASRDVVFRMQQILDAAPELDRTSIEQTAALPLGGRVKLDPWNAHVELMKNNRVPLLSAREKMPFQVTPLMPYLARFESERRSLADADLPDTTKSQAETVAVERPRN
ncbi:MAG: M48 family metalloprotease [bacterium]|nr:M48 family metalloprotease [bacterium]